MEQRTIRKWAWLGFSVIGGFTRGLPGWGPLIAGAPRSEWLPAVTLALLWCALGLIGFLGAVYRTRTGGEDGFRDYQWGMIAVFLVIPLVGLGFYALGTSLVQVGIDIVGAPAVLALWMFVEKRHTKTSVGQ